VATDNQGAATTSATVTVTVTTEPIPDPLPPIPRATSPLSFRPWSRPGCALGLAAPDDCTGRMFVYDQAGLVWVVIDGTGKLPNPLLDVRSRLVPLGNYDERGLLGLATHPDFVNHPLIYTYTSEPNIGQADFVCVMPPGVAINISRLSRSGGWIRAIRTRSIPRAGVKSCVSTNPSPITTAAPCVLDRTAFFTSPSVTGAGPMT